MAAKTHPLEAIGFVVIGVGLLVPPGILAYQGLHWLRTATWPRLPLALAWDVAFIPKLRTSWLGLQAVLDWFLDLPLAFASLAIPALGFYFVSLGMKWRAANLRSPSHHG